MARSFSAASDRIENGSPPDFAQGAASGKTFTVSVWINPSFTSNAGQRSGFYGCQSAGGEQCVFILFSGNLLWGTAGNISTSDSGFFTAGTWANWVMTGTTGANTETLYKNGSSIASGTGVNIGTPSTKIAVGNQASTDTNRVSNSTMADFAIWTVILTQTEITALSNGARPYTIRPQSLLSYTPIDGISSPEPDFNGAGTYAVSGSTIAFGPPFMQFTPRWPLNSPFPQPAASSFQPAWAIRTRIVVDGIGI